MADNDIYDSKRRYELVRDHLEAYLVPAPSVPGFQVGVRKYWIKNSENLKYFRRLIGAPRQKGLFDVRDTSYIRRNRLFRTLLLVGHFIEKDFAAVEREDVDELIAWANDINRSPKSKRDFNLDIKFLWKQIFPERDEKGRIADGLCPYVVRHLTGRFDRSREKLRGDKFSLTDFERLLLAFGKDARMQCLLSVAFESLARPQELLGRRLRDVELHDNYAKIYISEHGKEGVGFLRIIDSYPYLVRWIQEHPLRKNSDAWLFVNQGTRNTLGQFKTTGANKLLRERCAKIGISTRITLYSLKRNGVTHMRLAGKTDLEIQHTARWTSARQLNTYDLSTQEESFKVELIKRGKIKPEARYADLAPTSKTCLFCNTENGMSDAICSHCKRPLDRTAIEEELKKKETQFEGFNATLLKMAADQERLEYIVKHKLSNTDPAPTNEQITPELVKQILEADKAARN